MPRRKTRKNKRARTRTKKGGTYPQPSETVYGEAILDLNHDLSLNSLYSIKFLNNDVNNETIDELNVYNTADPFGDGVTFEPFDINRHLKTPFDGVYRYIEKVNTGDSGYGYLYKFEKRENPNIWFSIFKPDGFSHFRGPYAMFENPLITQGLGLGETNPDNNEPLPAELRAWSPDLVLYSDLVRGRNLTPRQRRSYIQDQLDETSDMDHPAFECEIKRIRVLTKTDWSNIARVSRRRTGVKLNSELEKHISTFV